MFSSNLGDVCRRALETQNRYWQIERDYQEQLAKRRVCCRNCSFFDDNPYLPCAINPSVAQLSEEGSCNSFEPKWR